MSEKIQYLKIKPYSSEKEARNHPSLAVVYECPKCRVGHALTNVSGDKVKCNICNTVYLKP